MSELYYISFHDKDGVLVKGDGVWDSPITAASHIMTVETDRDFTLSRVRDDAPIWVAPRGHNSVDGFYCRDVVWVNTLDWSRE